MFTGCPIAGDAADLFEPRDDRVPSDRRQGRTLFRSAKEVRPQRSLVKRAASAPHQPITGAFGQAALIQRCQVHKARNVLDHLPERQRPWVNAKLHRAYVSEDVTAARRQLHYLARQLETDHPSAAESIREGLDDTLAIIGLGLSPTPRTTNAIESLISRTRHVKRNVKRWRHGQMVVRWVAAGVLEAVKDFRRVKGHKEMPQLVAAQRRRDQQLGLVKKEEKVA